MRRTVWQGQHLLAIDDEGWEYAERVGAVEAVVILAAQDGEVLLVEQARAPAGGRVLELPAGLVDEGESPMAAGARELEEETGWRAAQVETLGSFYSSPGLTSERFTLVRATGLDRVGEGGGIDAEDITVHHVKLTEIAEFVAATRAEGVGIDAKLLMLLNPSSRP